MNFRYYNAPSNFEKFDVTTFNSLNDRGYVWVSKTPDRKILIQESYGLRLDTLTEKWFKQNITELFESEIVIRGLSYLIEVTFEKGDYSVGINDGYISEFVRYENKPGPVIRGSIYVNHAQQASEFLKAEAAYASNDIKTLKENLEFFAPNKYLEQLINEFSENLSRREMNSIEKSVEKHLSKLYDYDIENGVVLL